MAYNKKTSDVLVPTDATAWSPAPRIGERLNVVPLIEKTAPTDAPLITLIGTNSLSTACVSDVYRWKQEGVRPENGTIAGALANEATSTVSYTGDSLLKGDVIRFTDAADAELALVTASDPDSDTVTLTRGFAGSTRSAHAAGVPFMRVSSAFAIGADAAGDWYLSEPGQEYNVLQKFEAMIGISQMSQLTEAEKPLAQHVKDVLADMKIRFERTLLYGLRSTGVVPTAGGLEEFVFRSGESSCVVDSSGMPFAYNMVTDDMEGIMEAVGKPPDMLVVSPYQAGKIAEMASAIGTVTIGQNEERLGVRILNLRTQFGDVDVVVDRHVLPDRAYYLNSKLIGFGPLRGGELTMETLGKTGDSAKLYFWGYYTAEVRNPKAHRIRYNLYYPTS